MFEKFRPFAVELGHAFWPTVSWPSQVIKGIAVLFAVFDSIFSLTDQFGVVVKRKGEIRWETHQFQIGTAITVSLFAILFFWSCGMAWVKMYSIHIDDNIVQNGNNYRMTIINRGFSEKSVLILMDKMADENGLRDDWNARLPAELGRPTLSSGLSHKVNLFRLNGSHGGANGLESVRFEIEGDDSDGSHFLYGPLYSNTKNKIWFKVVVGDVSHSKWFSMHMIDSTSLSLRVVREDPPFLTSPEIG